MFQKVAFYFGVLLLQVTLSEIATAADWNVESVASMRTESNDNRRLTTADHERVDGLVLELKTNISAESAVSATEFKPRFLFERYTGTGLLESNANQEINNNQYLDMSTSSIDEDSRWTLSGNYSRDDTLTSEALNTGIVQTQRTKWSIDPQYIQEITERATINLGLSHSSVMYEDAAKVNLVNYIIKSIRGTASYNLTESTKISTTVYGSRLQPQGTGNETVTVGLNYGINYANQDALDWGLQIGGQKIEYKQTDIVSNDNEYGSTVDINIGKEFEYTRWTVSLNRSVIPSGVGRFLLQNKIILRNAYELTPSLQTNISITALQNQEIQQTSIEQNRDYQNAVVSLNWSVTPSWSLYSAYLHTRSKYETNTAEAISNALQLTLVYTDLNK